MKRIVELFNGNFHESLVLKFLYVVLIEIFLSLVGRYIVDGIHIKSDRQFSKKLS